MRRSRGAQCVSSAPASVTTPSRPGSAGAEPGPSQGIPSRACGRPQSGACGEPPTAGLVPFCERNEAHTLTAARVAVPFSGRAG
ncbi:hypothetical protein EXIGLDRAFT_737088 [Exidia glandulosa HHB12029]|uniref:Uncharacterized protein n=1 Tax=Exidia glandulosa HHB12029 TaxID=1314781 RepID=A0A165J4T4_EXIGL|nr:hypothetical protein EXIGLDRAFT_737088 [Exidia glandulosa HHB12029]